jgi:dienelactone hydrolase
MPRVCFALVGAAICVVHDEPRVPTYADHSRLMVVLNADGDEIPVRTASDWEVRRAHILAHLQAVMGPLPGGERRVPLEIRVVEEHREAEYTRRKITFAVEPGDRVPAWLLIPHDPPGPKPAALCLHQTTPIGKDEPAGLGGKPSLHYAAELAQRGFVTIAPDYPNFGEYDVDVYALGYASASMKGIWNHLRAVDVLVAMPEVDTGRIGVIGHSLGGHNAIFAALFDARIGGVVSSCGFNAFAHYYGGDIKGWSHAGYMPRLKLEYGLDLARVPFDFPELIGALAPRPVFVCAPVRDENFAVEGVRACIDAARPVYTLLRAADSLRVEYPDAEHDFPDDTRAAAYEFLARRLGR